MLAPIIYWGLILVNVAWLVLTIYFGLFYFIRKENGNLWVFAAFNVLSIIVLEIMLLVYHTWGWGITQYTNLVYTIMITLFVVTVLQAILGREPKLAATTK